jgi:hypothetical protein
MIGHSKHRGAVSMGVRTHSAHGVEPGGWATYVVLGGPITEPSILARGRMQLCDPGIEGSEQPFHHAALMDHEAAEAFVERCRESSQDLAARALEEIVCSHGGPKGCCVLTGPARPLPPLRGSPWGQDEKLSAAAAWFGLAVAAGQGGEPKEPGLSAGL